MLQNSAWESGVIDTKDGKKIYSSKMLFDYDKGEIKHIKFTVSTDKYQKGNYTMQVYHLGKMIGKTFRTLS